MSQQFASAQRTPAQRTRDYPAESSDWSDTESPPAQSLLSSDVQSLHTSDAESLENSSTPPAVVNKSTSSIFSKFLPDITILIARANSTNSTDITKEEATSLASTLSSIPSLKGISKVLNSPESIKQIIDNSKSTVKSSGEQTKEPATTTLPPPPHNSFASSARSSFQSHGDDATASASSQASLGQDPLGSSSNAAQADTSRAPGTASAPSARRRPATNRLTLVNDDDSTTDADSSRQSLSLSDDAASNRKGKSFTNRRHPFTPPYTGPGDLYAKQQVQQLKAPLPQAYRAAGTSRAATSTRAAAGAAGAPTMTTVPHEQSFMGQPFVEQFSTGSATATTSFRPTHRPDA